MCLLLFNILQIYKKLSNLTSKQNRPLQFLLPLL